jgi:hypothetical protein
MYIVRDIFHLKFGKYKDAKALIDEAMNKNMFPEGKNRRMLTDFTGHSYRLIMEEGYDSLADYEKQMSEGMGHGDWQQWYEKFKALVQYSQREILKQVM